MILSALNRIQFVSSPSGLILLECAFWKTLYLEVRVTLSHVSLAHSCSSWTPSKWVSPKVWRMFEEYSFILFLGQQLIRIIIVYPFLLLNVASWDQLSSLFFLSIFLTAFVFWNTIMFIFKWLLLFPRVDILQRDWKGICAPQCIGLLPTWQIWTLQSSFLLSQW